MNPPPHHSPDETSSAENNTVSPLVARSADSSAETVNAALIGIIPVAVVGGGIMVCGVLWLLSGGNIAMRAAGVVVLLTDIAVALWLRRYFHKRTAVKTRSAPHLNSDVDENRA